MADSTSIEHHLRPHLPANRLREVAPRVREICEKHGVKYLNTSWHNTLLGVLRQLSRLSLLNAGVLAA